jgi:dTDP-4-dehydrorhamnose reductase
MRQKKYKILITGAGGFVGKSLLNFLHQKIDFNSNKIFALYNSKIDKKKYHKIIKIKSNLLILKKTEPIFKKLKPDIIFHFAALKNPLKNENNVIEAFNKNFVITKNILENIDLKKTKIIFLSTDKVYDGKIKKPTEEKSLNPNTFYGKLKLQTEKLIVNNVLNYVILRVPIIHSNGESSKDSFIDNCLVKVRNKKKVQIAKNIKRQFIYVKELSEFLFMIRKTKKNGIYNIGSNLCSYYDRIRYIFRDDKTYHSNLLISKNIGSNLPVQDLNKKKFNKNFSYKFH